MCFVGDVVGHGDGGLTVRRNVDWNRCTGGDDDACDLTTG